MVAEAKQFEPTREDAWAIAEACYDDILSICTGEKPMMLMHRPLILACMSMVVAEIDHRRECRKSGDKIP